MSNTFVQPGRILTLTAPTGGVTSGTPCFIGPLFVIPLTTAVAGATFQGMVEGVHALTKTASQAWAELQKIYWDVANSRCDSSPLVGPLIGNAAVAIGSGSGETTGYVALLECAPYGEVISIRRRLTTAEINAGATLVPAVAGRRYRLVDAAALSYGGAATGLTTLDISGTVTTTRKLVAFAQASLTQSTLLRAGATGAALLADGASFTQNDANSGITVGVTGSALATATGVDIFLSYAIDPA
jgi:predicted RecA/RadA family phage recombinase